ncbi:hypothetical protein B0H13DRAFT_1872761 [Mycena leptocephala]|nr:hypothetical protein B0H13DRAFT_1872761 [Mycena leptocephala]
MGDHADVVMLIIVTRDLMEPLRWKVFKQVSKLNGLDFTEAFQKTLSGRVKLPVLFARRVSTVPASLLLPLLLQDSDTTIDSQNSLVLECDTDLLKYFDELAENDCLPTLDDLLEHASVIRERYACQTAYEQSLDKTDHDSAPSRTKVPQGSIWTPPTARKAPTAEHDDDADMPGLDEIPDDDEPTPREPEPNGDAKSPSVQHSRWLRAARVLHSFCTLRHEC